MDEISSSPDVVEAIFDLVVDGVASMNGRGKVVDDPLEKAAKMIIERRKAMQGQT